MLHLLRREGLDGKALFWRGCLSGGGGAWIWCDLHRVSLPHVSTLVNHSIAQWLAAGCVTNCVHAVPRLPGSTARPPPSSGDIPSVGVVSHTYLTLPTPHQNYPPSPHT